MRDAGLAVVREICQILPVPKSAYVKVSYDANGIVA